MQMFGLLWWFEFWRAMSPTSGYYRITAGSYFQTFDNRWISPCHIEIPINPPLYIITPPPVSPPQIGFCPALFKRRRRFSLKDLRADVATSFSSCLLSFSHRCTLTSNRIGFNFGIFKTSIKTTQTKLSNSWFANQRTASNEKSISIRATFQRRNQ